MSIYNGLQFLQWKFHHRCLTVLYVGLRKYWNFQSEANHHDCYNTWRFLFDWNPHCQCYLFKNEYQLHSHFLISFRKFFFHPWTQEENWTHIRSSKSYWSSFECLNGNIYTHVAMRSLGLTLIVSTSTLPPVTIYEIVP